MSSFTKNLILSPLKNGKNWTVRKEFFYDIGFEGSGNRITVPVGFVTDLTSIPKLFRGIFSVWGKYGKGAVVHDYLYFSHEKTRKEADYIFYENMIFLEVKKYKAKIIYNAVKLFGEYSYYHTKGYIIKCLEENITIPDMEKL